MSRLLWDQTSEKLFETGVKNGVLFPYSNGAYEAGIAWNGLTAVSEKPEGAEPTPQYADNIKYLNLMSTEEFKATIEAFMYPDEFAECDGSAAIATGVMVGQQTRKMFGFAYKTVIGNDVDGVDYGYKIHIVYGALAAPSEKAYNTISDSPEAIAFSWDVSTTPVDVTGKKATASIVIDSTKVDANTLATFEDILYGTAMTDPRLPLPDEIATLFGNATPSALSLSSIVPADDTSNIAIDANIVLTFNNEIQSEDIVVTSAAGVVVAGTKTWDNTGKIMTFNPTSNLANSTTYIVAIAGVVDIYAQHLTAAIKNFETVA